MKNGRIDCNCSIMAVIGVLVLEFENWRLEKASNSQTSMRTMEPSMKNHSMQRPTTVFN